MGWANRWLRCHPSDGGGEAVSECWRVDRIDLRLVLKVAVAPAHEEDTGLARGHRVTDPAPGGGRNGTAHGMRHGLQNGDKAVGGVVDLNDVLLVETGDSRRRKEGRKGRRSRRHLRNDGAAALSPSRIAAVPPPEESPPGIVHGCAPRESCNCGVHCDDPDPLFCHLSDINDD